MVTPRAVVGEWFLDAPTAFRPPAHVEHFFAIGEPPVCVNFGSMMLVEEGGGVLRHIVDTVVASGLVGDA